jgi:CRISPR-associated protein Csb2
VFRITVRFPLGVYHAQSTSDFATAEWPPHPVRLIAALTAAAHGRGRPAADLDAALRAVALLAAAVPPVIVAPRAGEPYEADGTTRVARLRGASRWAPRNHELGELRGGISPRDPGRGRTEVHKVGVAIGGAPVRFEWSELNLDDDAVAVLAELVEDLTVLGTARSPALAGVDTAGPPSDPLVAWAPTHLDAGEVIAQVRVATARTPADMDAWHARRAAPLRRDGRVAPAPYVPPVALGDELAYIHGKDAAALPSAPFDPEWWGDMLVVAVDRARGEDLPKAPAAFALARATRKALLDTYGPEGTPEQAPAILRGRDDQPHAAFVPLSFVAEPDRRVPGTGRGAAFADGRTLGVAVILPHPERVADVARQRLEVEAGLSRLLGLAAQDAVAVRVPGVGPVWLGLPDSRRIADSLRESRYRRPSPRWSTVTPVVHSRFQARKSEAGLLDQVTAECTDVGLPAPARVAVRRGPRFRGAPGQIARTGLPDAWTGPLQGPHAHLDLWFDEPVRGPVLLGRARHFGLGLCLPFDERPADGDR